MSWLETLEPRTLARLIGLLLLLSMPVGGYSLALTEGVDISAAGLLALGGDFSTLVSTYRTTAALDGLMVLLTLLIAIGLFKLLSPLNRPLACAVAVLKIADAAGKVLTAALSTRLAALFDAGIAADLWLAAERVQDQAWYVFHYSLVLSSLGFAIMFFLLFRSRYIPRPLAGYGVLASLGVVVSIVAMVSVDGAGAIVYPWYVIANGIAFISLTGWLLVAGVNTDWWQASQA